MSGPRSRRPRSDGADRAGVVSRAWTSSSRRASRRPSPSSARPPSQAWPVRRSQATTQSWSARRSGGRSWSTARSRAAVRRSRRGRSPGSRRDRRGTAAHRPGRAASRSRRRDEPAGDGERVRSGGRRLEDGDRIGGQVGPARVAARPGALEQDEAGQVAERLGGIDGARRGDPVRQAAEAKRRAGARCRDHAADDTAGAAGPGRPPGLGTSTAPQDRRGRRARGTG